MADIGQVNMEEMVRKYGEEEVARLMNEIMENNVMMLKLQKQIVELQIIEEEKKRRQIEIRKREEERIREQEEMNKWMEEYRKRNEKEKEEREKQRRVDKEWRKIESMKRREEKKVEKEWRYQEMRERKREENKQRAMEERKCFGCGGFGHRASHCRNEGKGKPIPVSSNKFEVLKVRVMQKGEGSGKEVAKDRKEILRKERAKRGVKVRQTKEKKEKYLREVTVKIRLKQEEKEEGIVTEALLDSGATRLVMSEEFAKKHRFRRMKLEKLVYVRNVDGMLNYAGPIVDTVEVEIFFKRYKERTSIDVIEGQKWSVILGMPWLARHNPEIDWKTGEVQMMRYPDECGKKWRTGRQTKPGWKKQEEKKKKKKMKRPMTDEEIVIMKIVAEKDEELDEENMIVVRKMEEMVPNCHIQVYLSGKLHPRGDATSEPYKPAFHGGHLSRNTSHGGAATLQVFCLPRRRYSYSTQSSMMELILSVSQH